MTAAAAPGLSTPHGGRRPVAPPPPPTPSKCDAAAGISADAAGPAAWAGDVAAAADEWSLVTAEREHEAERQRRREASAKYHREPVRAHGVAWAEGGDWMRLTTPPPKAKPKGGGGQRGEIQGFSRESRMRLMVKVGQIDQRQVEPRRVWFVTLTYPASWPTDPARWKRHLKAWRKRLARRWGVTVALWKIEPQRRGAPHFHLLILATSVMVEGLEAVGQRWKGQAPRRRRVTVWRGGELEEFRKWTSKAWAKVVAGRKKPDPHHVKVGTNVEPVEAWGKVTAYASKYLGKCCQFRDRATGAPLPIGRYWGVWGSWPRSIRSRALRPAAWSRLRRTVRKLRSRTAALGRQSYLRGRDRACTVFMPAATRDRLIEWVSPHPAHRQLGQAAAAATAPATETTSPADWSNLARDLPSLPLVGSREVQRRAGHAGKRTLTANVQATPPPPPLVLTVGRPDLGPHAMASPRACGFRGTPGEWFGLGEGERQRRHRAARGVGKWGQARQRRPRVARE